MNKTVMAEIVFAPEEQIQNPWQISVNILNNTINYERKDGSLKNTFTYSDGKDASLFLKERFGYSQLMFILMTLCVASMMKNRPWLASKILGLHNMMAKRKSFSLPKDSNLGFVIPMEV